MARTRRPLGLKEKFKAKFQLFMDILKILVNITSYLAMTYGLFRGLYFAYFKPDAVKFIATVAMTLFAIYINLKNPNN